MKAKLIETEKFKIFRSEEINWNFDKITGYMETWGRTKDEDPTCSKYGPLIADIEITTICNGPAGVPCPFCYKSNTMNGNYMSFETYKTIADKLPKTVTQIAFGVDATCTSNPDMWKIFDYTREKGIIPNLTVANITEEVAQKIHDKCGACAVSRYHNKNWCYDSVKRLTDTGMDQVNIHQLVASTTFDQIMETIDDIQEDPRLAKLNAIVLLSLKQKGRGEKFNVLSDEKYKLVVKKLVESKINFGFDSCGAERFLKAIKELYPERYDEIVDYVEPCESALFSSYINTDGDFYPCSFSEGVPGWEEGLSVLECDNFVEDIWNNEKTLKFTNELLNTEYDSEVKCRNCPLYNICEVEIKHNLKEGDLVTYKEGTPQEEIGIVKSVCEDGEHVFAVYGKHQIDNYQNYTAQRTRIEDLT